MVSFRWYEILTYLKKHIFRKVPLSEIIGTAIGCFFGLGLVSYITMQQHLPLLIASFGATSLLIFSAPSAPMAQPRNVIGGHVIAAIIGVTCYKLFGLSWLSITLAATLAIIAMMLTDTAHPPGGATALVAIMGEADYSFVFTPILFGALILVCIAVIVNQFVPGREYPTHRKK
ncbi:MAG: HPP family protein [Clostridiales bacterium]|nr:MAG: HPP family protein [Clostridiales bacterium]